MNDQVLIKKLLLRQGPWDKKPEEYVTKLNMIVLVHNLISDTIEFEFELDYGNADDRKFLGRLSFWCITNKRSTECMSPEEWKKMNKE